MIRLLFLGATLCSLASCAQEKADPNPSPLGCEVALAYAESFVSEVRAYEDFAGRRLALSTATGWIAPTQEELDALLARGSKISEGSDHELIAAAVRHRDLDVLGQCASLREWVERERVITDEQEIQRLTKSEEWPVVVLTMSMPVLAPDAGEALLYASKYAGGLSGVTLAVSYRRDEQGKWDMIDQQVLANS
jgi:hypothetical protein